ncbi:bifunctional 5,10-methylenetetrahydrofolate dehydrogenase/5,10-methenyltetrahydrofolate cyclohydrolase [Anseongella ginsenosidimutans]|nr:bifunctional 5,10-methylenetetrahydrofolate dehydrogenase/5,10-methenyltetrahydrofolate cyclohydrolase [Anseongella ginsenosidimutans]QEC53261.1 bifunctional 5,10-methylenetetrahydrofolate dehydrogenase/5,10-methenyltetrahydrofolate cyclohydrolase [Anseongella ginsenosidimutans]
MGILDGKKAAEYYKEEIAREAAEFTRRTGKKPYLVTILVGNNGASETYVASKLRNSEKVGFNASLVRFEDTVTEEALLGKIDELNASEEVDGILVQLPLPAHIEEKKVIMRISPLKDVDGFHPESLGKMLIGLPTFLPATPYGIMELLDYYKVETEGKHCVVMGRSNIVGTPISLLLSRQGNPGNCTVTITHSRTKDLETITRQADILIVAVGRPEFVTADMVTEGAVVIDVGIHRIADKNRKSGYRLVGDVKFDEVAPKCGGISPVPGGVGLMTIVGLLKNTLEAAKRRTLPS